LDEESALSERPHNDVWEIVANAFHQEFIGVLRSGDADALAGVLACACREPITHGLGPGRAVFEAASTEEGSRGIAALCVDRLAGLAEAVGALPVENPEQGRLGVNLYLDPAVMADAIERMIGISIRPSMAMGYFGVPVRDHLFFVRSADHVYTAWRCHALGARRIVEIGGGLGGAALYSLRFGAHRYTIFDLPVMNVVQGYALLKAGHAVSLLGEPDQVVMVRPWWRLEASPECDVVVNQDSFPEIERAFVLDYLRHIRRFAGRLLSINQEAGELASADGRRQHVVSELVDSVGGFVRVSRVPYWLRRGYVEEIYEVVDRG
jgi:hypothetical protein